MNLLIIIILLTVSLLTFISYYLTTTYYNQLIIISTTTSAHCLFVYPTGVLAPTLPGASKARPGSSSCARCTTVPTRPATLRPTASDAEQVNRSRFEPSKWAPQVVPLSPPTPQLAMFSSRTLENQVFHWWNPLWVSLSPVQTDCQGQQRRMGMHRLHSFMIPKIASAICVCDTCESCIHSELSINGGTHHAIPEIPKISQNVVFTLEKATETRIFLGGPFIDSPQWSSPRSTVFHTAPMGPFNPSHCTIGSELSQCSEWSGGERSRHWFWASTKAEDGGGQISARFLLQKDREWVGPSGKLRS